MYNTLGGTLVGQCCGTLLRDTFVEYCCKTTFIFHDSCALATSTYTLWQLPVFEEGTHLERIQLDVPFPTTA